MARTILGSAGCLAWLLFAHAAHAQAVESQAPAAAEAPAAPAPEAAPETAPATPPPAAGATGTAATTPATNPAVSPEAAAAAAPPPVKVPGFNILLTLGYGKSTDEVYGLQLEPYAFGFGLDFGYTWAFGFRLGGYASYSPGRDITQKVTPLGGVAVEVTSDTTSVSGGLSIGYDVPLYFLILRHTVNLGMSWMSWDFGERPWPPLGLTAGETSTVGFNVVPGLTLLWPYGKFECGLGFDYFVQTNFKLPNAAVGKLVVGLKL